jgi:hypothetical protein
MSSPFGRSAALFAASALVLAAAAPAFAASDNDARNAAIAACRTAVAEQFSAEPSSVRMDRINTRGRTVELRLEVRKDGKRLGVADCTYNRRAETIDVVVIEPAAQTAGN